MTTTAERPALLEAPTVALDRIHHHPANPRRTAVASTEMVESILAGGIHVPLMVAPHPSIDGEFVLIDGHRRDNGARQAGLEQVPVNVRYDLVTEAQQLEVMVITGLQGEHLTPVEEAAAYEQLHLAGMDDDAIARATGFSKRRVRDRLKLNDLSTKVRDGVHDGEITLTDIQALAEFDDDHQAYAQVEAALGTPNFRTIVHNVRAKVERDKLSAETIATFEALDGVRVRTIPGGGGMSAYDDASVTYSSVRRLGSYLPQLGNVEDHAGHLGWVLGDWDYATPEAVCLDTTVHAEWKTQAPPKTDDTEWQKQQAEREAERARTAAADQARREWMTQHLAGLLPTKSHQGLVAFARPYLVGENLSTGDEVLIPEATATAVLAAFAADLADRAAEHFTDRPWQDDRDEMLAQLAMWDWLKGAGYPMSDVDVELRTRLETRLADLADAADG